MGLTVARSHNHRKFGLSLSDFPVVMLLAPLKVSVDFFYFLHAIEFVSGVVSSRSFCSIESNARLIVLK